jgi:hypothetical protein
VRRAAASITLACALVVAGLGSAAPAGASTRQLAMLEEDVGLLADPATTMHTLRSLGVGVVRLSIHWDRIAPAPLSRRRPRRFDAADPAAYPPRNWAPYDQIARDARADGIRLDYLVTGSAPLWATGPGASRTTRQWRPSAREYGRFVQAIATRYSGAYRPRGERTPLPRATFWELWNEPNFGQDLAPQATHDSAVSSSPGMYRALVAAAWAALQRAGHGRDTILIGGLSPRGFNAPRTRRWPQGLPGYFSTTKPLQFTRTLYCVDSRYRPLRGRAASAVGCPTTATGSRRFRAQNPALFAASGFGIHPYPINLPPNRADSRDPDYVEFSEIPRLAAALDRLQRTYGSRPRLPVYNTEYGYITRPPRARPFVSPATAAAFDNWAEYLSWRNRRVATTMQYLLRDPNPTSHVPEYGGFASGLTFFDGRAKPAYDAYRMPLFLPRTSSRRGRALEVWGCVRPAPYASADTGAVQSVQIQLGAGSRGPFRTIDTVPISSPRGYFDVRIAFPSSGVVRLAWTYPPADPKLSPIPTTVHSRLVKVTIH